MKIGHEALPKFNTRGRFDFIWSNNRKQFCPSTDTTGQLYALLPRETFLFKSRNTQCQTLWSISQLNNEFQYCSKGSLLWVTESKLSQIKLFRNGKLFIADPMVKTASRARYTTSCFTFAMVREQIIVKSGTCEWSGLNAVVCCLTVAVFITAFTRYRVFGLINLRSFWQCLKRSHVIVEGF